jgi:hypothetical protein
VTYTLDEARKLLPHVRRYLKGLREEFVAMKHHEFRYNKGHKAARTSVLAAKSRCQQWLKLLHDRHVGVLGTAYRGIALIPAAVPGPDGPVAGYYVYYDTRDDITGYVVAAEFGNSTDLHRFTRQLS